MNDSKLGGSRGTLGAATGGVTGIGAANCIHRRMEFSSGRCVAEGGPATNAGVRRDKLNISMSSITRIESVFLSGSCERRGNQGNFCSALCDAASCIRSVVRRVGNTRFGRDVSRL